MSETTWLTQEAYDRLSAELEQLVKFGRKEIAKKISEAREEGDLKENGGYHAAREEQGKIEARIVRLEELLASAVVGEETESDGSVQPGNIITLTMPLIRSPTSLAKPMVCDLIQKWMARGLGERSQTSNSRRLMRCRTMCSRLP